MASGSAFWSYVAPQGDKMNYVLNPSCEYGTTGWAAVQSATLGSTSAHQQFGAWSLSVTPNSNGTSGAFGGTWTAANGSTYVVSAYANLANGVAYRLAVGDSSGVNQVASTAITGGGTWMRYSVSFTEASGAVRSVVLQKTSGNSVAPFYVDGVQVEDTQLTTYQDGDPGNDGTWQAAPHASMSFRSGAIRTAGSIIPLSAIGLTPVDSLGAGMPPIVNTAQSYAILDGAQFQRSRADARSITLTSYPGGSTWGDFHITRRTIIDAIKRDLVSPVDQPVRFLYTGANGTQQIDAVYDSGLELGQMSGRGFVENLAVKFVAYSPFWESTTQEGTSLAPRIALGSVNYIAQRSPSGVWGSMGKNGTAIAGAHGAFLPVVYSLAYNAGTLFAGGVWGTVGGTVGPNLAMWYKSGSTWGTLTAGGTVAQGVYALAYGSAGQGSLFFGGTFQTAGGTGVQRIAYFAGANFGSLAGGSIGDSSDPTVSALLYSRGTLFVGGHFGTAGGTSTRALAMYTPGAWGTCTNGTISGASTAVYTIEPGRYADNRVFVGGNFTSAGGTSAVECAFWNGSFGTLSTGADNSVFALKSAPNGKLLAAGQFTTLGGVSAPGVGEWNGISWDSLGAGLAAPVGTTSMGRCLDVEPASGRITIGGRFTNAGSINVPNGIAVYTSSAQGGAWVPVDIDLPGSVSFVYAMARAEDGQFYIGGDFSGTATAASVATIVNHGRSVAYPTIRLRFPATSGTCAIRQVAITNVPSYLYFNNMILYPGDVVTIQTEPGNKSITRGDGASLFSTLIPGSNLSSFGLLPGTNTISFFSDNDSLQPDIFWTPHHWSADAGTSFA